MMRYLPFIVLVLIGCSNVTQETEAKEPEKNNLDFLVLDDECTDHFNRIFKQFTLDSIYYQFDSVYYLNPFNINDFYSESDLESFVFFKLLNSEVETNLAIQNQENDLPYHKMYFFIYHRERMYIDEGSYFNCNASFLNECGVKVLEKESDDSASLLVNLRDSRLEETWLVDSCFGEQKFNKISFAEKNLVVDDTIGLSYNQFGNEFNLADTSKFILSKIAISSNNLIVEDRKTKPEPSYYYLKKLTLTQAAKN